MPDHTHKLDDIFLEQLGFEFKGQPLDISGLEVAENIESISIDYEGQGLYIIVGVMRDRLLEQYTSIIKHYKKSFPESHFIFVSNGGKTYDLYNSSSSGKLKKITYDELTLNKGLFEEKITLFDVEQAADGTDLRIKIDRAFDVNDKVTKKFFDRFAKIHK